MECGHHGNYVKVTDEDSFLSRSMMIKAKNIIMQERIWISRVIEKTMKQPLDTDTDAQFHDERVITVREEPCLHVESHQREVKRSGEWLSMESRNQVPGMWTYSRSS